MFVQQLHILFKIEVAEEWIAGNLELIVFKLVKKETQFLFQFMDGFFHSGIFYRGRYHWHERIGGVFAEGFFAEDKISQALQLIIRRYHFPEPGFAGSDAHAIGKMFDHLLQCHLSPPARCIGRKLLQERCEPVFQKFGLFCIHGFILWNDQLLGRNRLLRGHFIFNAGTECFKDFINGPGAFYSFEFTQVFIIFGYRLGIVFINHESFVNDLFVGVIAAAGGFSSFDQALDQFILVNFKGEDFTDACFFEGQ